MGCSRQAVQGVAETQALQVGKAGWVVSGLAALGWVAAGCTRQEVQEAGVEAEEAAAGLEVPVMVAGVLAVADCTHQAVQAAMVVVAAGLEV